MGVSACRQAPSAIVLDSSRVRFGLQPTELPQAYGRVGVWAYRRAARAQRNRPRPRRRPRPRFEARTFGLQPTELPKNAHPFDAPNACSGQACDAPDASVGLATCPS
jgi:hypothetical protein